LTDSMRPVKFWLFGAGDLVADVGADLDAVEGVFGDGLGHLGLDDGVVVDLEHDFLVGVAGAEGGPFVGDGWWWIRRG